MSPGAEVVAEAVGDLERRAMHAAEAEEEAKVVPVARLDLEAKAGQEATAGLAVGVEAGAKARRKVMYGARAGLGGPSHEAVAVKRAMPKTKRERGALATAAAAVLAAVII